MMPLTPPSVFRQARNHVAIHTTAAATLLTYSTSSKTGRLNTIREAWRSKEKRAATTGEEGEEGRVETEVEEKDQTNEGLGHYEKCYRERDRSPLSLPLSSPVHISPLKVVMATEEEEYEAFLEKANQDSGAASASAKNGERGDFSSSANNSKQEGKMTVNSAAVPPVLEEVQEYYISDADEPFVPVSLQWKERKLPSAGKFKKIMILKFVAYLFPSTKRQWLIINAA